MCDFVEERDVSEPTVLIPTPTQQGYRQNDCGAGAREFRSESHSNPSTRDSRDYRIQSDSNTISIEVPSHTVCHIIGKGGSNIRELELESEAKIKICDSNGITTDITLSGTDAAISKLHGMIDDLILDRASQTAPKPATNNKTILPPIVKGFYKEDPKVAAMTAAAVTRWRRANNDIQIKRTYDKPDLIKSQHWIWYGCPIPNPVLTFEQAFQHYPEILQEIYKQGFIKPSPIQSQAWPILLRGEDMIGIAQTGTGKTLAFLLPALIHIDGQTLPRDERQGPTVLILAPTRELALQIDKEVAKYQYRGIKSVCLYGGGNRREQIKVVEKGVDIVIATPGRLNDLISTRHLNMINISYIVLYEADRMLDKDWEPQIQKCLCNVRPDKQTVMTSTMWPSGVSHFADLYMKDPIQVHVGSLDLAPVHTVTQQLWFVEEDDKEAALFEFIQDLDPTDKVIIFCDKKAQVTHISTELSMKGIECQSLHGDRDQSDREAALEEIVDGKVNILVATDVVSRGVDIKDLTHVVNFDFPRHIEEYVHRVDRTGRAGKTGIALSFITRRDSALARELIKIMEKTHQEVPNQLKQMANKFEAMKLRRDQKGRGRGKRNGLRESSFGGGGRRGC